MASVGAIWGPATLRLLRHAATRASKAMRQHLAGASRPLQGELQAIPIRSGRTGRQPIHPAALLRQQKRGGRWFSSASAQNINNAVRRFMSSESGASTGRFARSAGSSSNTSRRVGQWSGRAPFASALRPNLTGGALPRSSGGYSLGGNGARYFSHTPAAPAQVVQNVSQAMRAFLLSGQKLRYDGVNARGQKQYRAVSALEDKAMNKLGAMAQTTPGSFIDFQLSPTVTALSPLAAAIASASGASGFQSIDASAANLNTDGFLDLLSGDFARTLKDLKVVLTDLQRLSALGDLPIALEKKDLLRVRFPGMDAEAVERLCADIGLQRGIVGQDPDFDESAGVDVALRFPFAPDSNATLTSPGGSARSLDSHKDIEMSSSLDDDSFIRAAFASEVADNPWLQPEEYSSLSSSSKGLSQASEDYDGLEGIHRFLAECDRAQGRLG